jgi:hypothetical protein
MTAGGIMRHIAFVGLVGLVSSLTTAPPAHAWGDRGHRTVCAIAYHLLDVGDRKEVDRLTQLYRRIDGRSIPSFVSSCTFADVARRNARDKKHPDVRKKWRYFKRFDQWHFLNVPRETRTVKAEHCADNCVLHGIDYHAGRLADGHLEDWKRAEALFFLGHWVGDVHQPLHVSFKDDTGGNDITPIAGDYYPPSVDTLHAVWDSGIIAAASPASQEKTYAETLAGGVTPDLRTKWGAVEPLGWAQESYEVTITPASTYCSWENGSDGIEQCADKGTMGRSLGKSYETEFRPTVELRLQQAGARLADRIHQALAAAH